MSLQVLAATLQHEQTAVSAPQIAMGGSSSEAQPFNDTPSSLGPSSSSHPDFIPDFMTPSAQNADWPVAGQLFHTKPKPPAPHDISLQLDTHTDPGQASSAEAVAIPNSPSTSAGTGHDALPTLTLSPSTRADVLPDKPANAPAAVPSAQPLPILSATATGAATPVKDTDSLPSSPVQQPPAQEGTGADDATAAAAAAALRDNVPEEYYVPGPPHPDPELAACIEAERAAQWAEMARLAAQKPEQAPEPTEWLLLPAPPMPDFGAAPPQEWQPQVLPVTSHISLDTSSSCSNEESASGVLLFPCTTTCL